MSSSNRQLFKADISLAFDCNGRREEIDQKKIAYVLIEHNYEIEVLPIIYISLFVSNKLYDDIVKYKDSAKFFLSIKKVNCNGITNISKDVISDTFSYIPSTTNPNFREDLATGDEFIDNAFKRITIGLVSDNMISILRKTFNGIYNNIDQKTLLGIALEGTNCVIETPYTNKSYSSIIVPPLRSRYKMIKFIFGKDNFYNTRFIYFMDFEKSYLVSKNGNNIDARDGQLSSIILDVRSVSEIEAYYDGIEIKNGAYYMYVNPADCKVTLNQGTNKIVNQLVTVDDDNESEVIDLNIDRGTDSGAKQVFVRTDDPTIKKSDLELNTVTIELVQQHIDGSIFTPNKSILVNNYGEYSKYNGKYYMTYKREFFRGVAGEFLMSTNVGLKKVVNIQPDNGIKNNTYVSPSSARTTSSNYGVSSSPRPTVSTTVRIQTSASTRLTQSLRRN